MIKLAFVAVSCLFLIQNSDAAGQSQQVVRFSQAARDRIHAATKTCVAPGEDHDELLKLVRDGKYRDDETFIKFIYCAYTTSGFAHDDGTVDIDAASSLFSDPGLMRKVIAECDKKRGTTPETNTHEYFKCFQNTSPLLFDVSR